ncbi:hypothetical protein [Brevundimonas fontaquae]|uniref:Uncharacterized protein n=1 Tax=Brevundimonas fontaquae TaxID=2813778 RepID=A0ABX7LXC5_9CAUL|nr:hypothetical protein [Brevundimonas fontaquae]QSF55153.1 hypothetical protein JX001_04945 [Brevundimonas fontaquae]
MPNILSVQGVWRYDAKHLNRAWLDVVPPLLGSVQGVRLVEITGRLIEMKRALTLLTDEQVFEGWAVSRKIGEELQPGLAVITNWRIIFLDPTAGMSAIPISREVRVTRLTPTTLIIQAWHDQMILEFEGPSPLATVKALLKQSPGWASIGPGRESAGSAEEHGRWRDRMADGGVTVQPVP